MTAATPWSALDAIDADPAERARWLEKALTGTTLAEVISQLSALKGGRAAADDVPPEAVRAWLGDEADAVLEHGLARLSRARLDELFRRPTLLTGLQELVLCDGGDHWNRLVAADASLGEIANRQRRQVGRLAPSVAGAVVRPAGWSGRRLAAILAPLAAAAAVLLWVVPTLRQPQRGPANEGIATVEGGASRGTASPDGTSPVNPRGSDDRSTVTAGNDPASPAVPNGGGPANGPAWPTHPWQRLERSTVAKRPDEPGMLAVGSRQWSRQLREADSLSPAQLMDAARQAHGGITAIDGLVTNQGIQLEEGRATQVQDRCRQALARIDELRASPELRQGDAEAVAQAKADILRAIEEVEQALEAVSDAAGDGQSRP